MAKKQNPWLVALAGWLIPGWGHLLIGERDKGALFGIMIVATYATGLILGSFRNVFIGPGRWALLAQIPAGVPALLSFVHAHVTGLRAVPQDVSIRIYDIGTLYTSVAGLLNALLAFDAGIKAHERLKGVKIER